MSAETPKRDAAFKRSFRFTDADMAQEFFNLCGELETENAKLWAWIEGLEFRGTSAAEAGNQFYVGPAKPQKQNP